MIDRLLVTLTLVVSALLAPAVHADDDPNDGFGFSVQGRLVVNGAPLNLPGGTPMRFSLWESAEGAFDQIGVDCDQPLVPVYAGLFSTVIDIGVRADGLGQWLQIEVDLDGPGGSPILTVLQPRTRLRDVPTAEFALRSEAGPLPDGPDAALFDRRVGIGVPFLDPDPLVVLHAGGFVRIDGDLRLSDLRRIVGDGELRIQSQNDQPVRINPDASGGGVRVGEPANGAAALEVDGRLIVDATPSEDANLLLRAGSTESDLHARFLLDPATAYLDLLIGYGAAETSPPTAPVARFRSTGITSSGIGPLENTPGGVTDTMEWNLASGDDSFLRFRTGGSSPFTRKGTLYSFREDAHFFVTANTRFTIAASSEVSSTPDYFNATPAIVVDLNGQVGINANPTHLFQVSEGGAYCDGNNWFPVSDAASKHHFEAIDAEDVLARLAGMPVQLWTYREDPDDVRHLGPTAQDFMAAFGFGDNDRTITPLDADGVAFASIQALLARVEAQEARIAELETAAAAAERDQLRARLERLETLIRDREVDR